MKSIILLFIMLLSITSFAQQATIDGTVCTNSTNCPKYICENSTINMTAGVTSGSIDSLIWKERIWNGTSWGTWVPIGTTGIQNIPVYEVANSSHMYRYWLIVYQNNQQYWAFTDVYVNSEPTAILLSNYSTICVGNEVTFTASNGGTNYQFKINGAIMQNGASSSFTTSSLANADTVTVTITANGCTKTSNPIIMTVNPGVIPTVTAMGPTTVCDGDSVLLLSSLANSYVWYKNGSILNTTTQSYVARSSGDYQVYVAGACSGMSNATTVTKNPLPIAIVTPSGDTEVCFGNNIILTAQSATGLSYQWQHSFNDGLTWENISGAINPQITINYSGTFRIQTIDGTSGCINYSH